MKKNLWISAIVAMVMVGAIGVAIWLGSPLNSNQAASLKVSKNHESESAEQSFYTYYVFNVEVLEEYKSMLSAQTYNVALIRPFNNPPTITQRYSTNDCEGCAMISEQRGRLAAGDFGVFEGIPDEQLLSLKKGEKQKFEGQFYFKSFLYQFRSVNLPSMSQINVKLLKKCRVALELAEGETFAKLPSGGCDSNRPEPRFIRWLELNRPECFEESDMTFYIQ